MEAKINELNNKVAESCSSFEDVMAYVDAHVADCKRNFMIVLLDYFFSEGFHWRRREKAALAKALRSRGYSAKDFNFALRVCPHRLRIPHRVEGVEQVAQDGL